MIRPESDSRQEVMSFVRAVCASVHVLWLCAVAAAVREKARMRILKFILIGGHGRNWSWWVWESDDQ